VNFHWEGLVLLSAVRPDGTEVKYDERVAIAKSMGLMCTPQLTAPVKLFTSFSDFLTDCWHLQCTLEGWVLQAEDGSRSKLVHSQWKAATRAIQSVHPYIMWDAIRMGRSKSELMADLPPHAQAEANMMITALEARFQEVIDTATVVGELLPAWKALHLAETLRLRDSQSDRMQHILSTIISLHGQSDRVHDINLDNPIEVEEIVSVAFKAAVATTDQHTFSASLKVIQGVHSLIQMETKASDLLHRKLMATAFQVWKSGDRSQATQCENCTVTKTTLDRKLAELCLHGNPPYPTRTFVDPPIDASRPANLFFATAEEADAAWREMGRGCVVGLLLATQVITLTVAEEYVEQQLKHLHDSGSCKTALLSLKGFMHELLKLRGTNLADTLPLQKMLSKEIKQHNEMEQHTELHMDCQHLFDECVNPYETRQCQWHHSDEEVYTLHQFSLLYERIFAPVFHFHGWKPAMEHQLWDHSKLYFGVMDQKPKHLLPYRQAGVSALSQSFDAVCLAAALDFEMPLTPFYDEEGYSLHPSCYGLSTSQDHSWLRSSILQCIRPPTDGSMLRYTPSWNFQQTRCKGWPSICLKSQLSSVQRILNVDLLGSIFELSERHLIFLSLVCRQWKQVMASPALMRALCHVQKTMPTLWRPWGNDDDDDDDYSYSSDDYARNRRNREYDGYCSP